MSFLYQEWLLTLPILAVVAFALRWWDRRRVNELNTLVSPRLWRVVIPGFRPDGRQRKIWAWTLAMFFLILALSGPYWGQKETLVQSSGMDWMVVLDVSNSMLVQDVSPSRLQRSKYLIRTLVEEFKENRFGLVAFAGRSALLVPLTRDFEYFEEVLEETDQDSVMLQGTDIGLAIAAAVSGLERGAVDFGDPVTRKSGIILVTDGEDFGDRIREAIGRNQVKGVEFILVGVGTPEGGEIPVYDRSGVERGKKRDASGNTVIAAYRPEALQNLAELTRSSFYHYTGRSSVRDEIASRMKYFEQGGGRSDRKIQPIHRYQWPLAIALILLFLEMSLSLTFLSRVSSGIVIFLFSSPVLGFDLEAIYKNNRAVEAIKEGRVSDGLNDLGEASLANPDRPELLYNQGVGQLKAERFSESAKSFSEAAQMFEREDRPQEAMNAIVSEAEAYEKGGRPDLATRSLLRALSSAKKVKDEEAEQEIRQKLIRNQQQAQSGGSGEDPDSDQESDGDDQKEAERGASEDETNKRKERHQFKEEDSKTLMRALADQQKEIRKRFENRNSRKQGKADSPQGKDW